MGELRREADGGGSREEREGMRDESRGRGREGEEETKIGKI